ncbi:transposase [Undibacterium sp. CY18W]|uniref:Transposase n=1 Tax=Undibacterium hunanense TaxID=2762292 RepID=A0ABR6ZRE3_9BURK|nr:transposase [Undibacterium hunanense]MBC3918446.1 transposase [Undibacterium hunanense]
MARLARLVIPHQQHHVIQRGNAGAMVFIDAEDYAAFLDWLKQAASLFDVAIHAYALLPDHLHLLLTPGDETGLGKMMQWLGRHYVPYFNRKYQRTGTLWQGRYRATVIESAVYFIPCSIYIESNPQRAGLVTDLLDYTWSSYRHHIGLHIDPLITDHSTYWALGNTPFQREAAYRENMEHGLSGQQIMEITQATSKAWMLGSSRFKIEMSKLTERRVEPIKRGRPRKIAVNS